MLEEMVREAVGPCCICSATGPTVRTFIALAKLCPIPGRGWGCVVCSLPSDGAQAVVCDACIESVNSLGGNLMESLVYACRGFPGVDGRVPVGELTGEHHHDMRFHPEAEPPANSNGATF